MGKHKHYEMIKLWAATGCKMQHRYDGRNPAVDRIWVDCERDPFWSKDRQYRKKPTQIQYRRYLARWANGSVRMHNHDRKSTVPIAEVEAVSEFVEWVDFNWLTYEY